MTTVGIQSIKAFSLVFVSFLVQSIKSFKDGFQALDLKDFVDEAMNAALQAGAFKNIKAEIKDGISEAEAAELHGAIKQAFIDADLGLTNEAEVDKLAGAVADAALANLKVFYAAKELIAARKGVDVADL